MKNENDIAGKSFAIYARAGEDEIRHSLQRQIRNCMAYVNEVGGTLISVHAERSCSCGPSQGSEFKALLELVEEGVVDYLVCESLDRLCSPVTEFTALSGRLDAKGVKVVTVGGMMGAYGTHRIAQIVSAHMWSDRNIRIRRGKALAKALWK